MDLFLIRHGESANNAVTDLSKRVADPNLTDLGRQQAEQLAAGLIEGRHLYPGEREQGKVLDRLYTSAMRRSLQTSAPTSAALNLPAAVWIDVHEMGGLWVTDPHTGEPVGATGVTPDQLEQELPGAVFRDTEISDKGWWTGGQESPSACQGRAIAVAAELRAQATGTVFHERVGIVSHGDFISALLKALLDGLPGPAVKYHLGNTGISRLHLGGEGTVVHYVNRVDHLDDARWVSH
ncbi:MAG: histidine phosphatase family protein [Gemmatimonadetes bacterium]|jgi:broad specificity phosphatase PhoE|nr:histidine phosphatase family protein [Gemmatimonadota bacterium]MBT6144967.1 histidine phosphatase family protein [Gemmatimonadota bacterium]MBT7860912.1 histidine phosphatase family protein [Gemmatimonadota bacterium]